MKYRKENATEEEQKALDALNEQGTAAQAVTRQAEAQGMDISPEGVVEEINDRVNKPAPRQKMEAIKAKHPEKAFDFDGLHTEPGHTAVNGGVTLLVNGKGDIVGTYDLQVSGGKYRSSLTGDYASLKPSEVRTLFNVAKKIAGQDSEIVNGTARYQQRAEDADILDRAYRAVNSYVLPTGGYHISDSGNIVYSDKTGYENVPDSMLGFHKDPNNNSYKEPNGKRKEYAVSLYIPNQDMSNFEAADPVFEDSVSAFNLGQATEIARRNWPDCVVLRVDESGSPVRETGSSGNSKVLPLYSEKQYNNWGWAVHSGALTSKELTRLESLNGAKLHGDNSVRGKTKEGYTMLSFGEEHGVDNVVAVISNRELGNPKIERVYRIDSDNENYNETVREVIYERERELGNKAGKYVEDAFPEGTVSGYAASDSVNYQEYRLERQQSAGTDSGNDNGYDQGLQYGSGSIEGNRADAEEVDVNPDIRYQDRTEDSEILDKAYLDSLQSRLNNVYENVSEEEYRGIVGKILAALNGIGKNDPTKMVTPVRLLKSLADKLGTHIYEGFSNYGRNSAAYYNHSRAILTNRTDAGTFSTLLELVANQIIESPSFGERDANGNVTINGKTYTRDGLAQVFSEWMTASPSSQKNSKVLREFDLAVEKWFNETGDEKMKRDVQQTRDGMREYFASQAKERIGAYVKSLDNKTRLNRRNWRAAYDRIVSDFVDFAEIASNIDAMTGYTTDVREAANYMNYGKQNGGKLVSGKFLDANQHETGLKNLSDRIADVYGDDSRWGKKKISP